MGIKETFTVLSAARSPQVVPALMGALDQQDPRLVKAAVNALMDQRSPLGFGTLLRRLETFPPEIQDIIGGGLYRMRETLADIIHSGAPGLRTLILKLLEGNTSPDSLEFLVLFLEDDDAANRERAAAAIEASVIRFADEKAQAEGDFSRVSKRMTTSVRSLERLREDLRLVTKALERGIASLAFHQFPIVVRGAYLLGAEGYELLQAALKREGRVNSVKDAVIDHLVRDNSSAAYQFILNLVGNELGYFRAIGGEILAAKSGVAAAGGLLAELEGMSDDRFRALLRANGAMPWLRLLGHHANRLPEHFLRMTAGEVERVAADANAKLPLWGVLAGCGLPEVAKSALERLLDVRDKDAADAELARLLTIDDETTQIFIIEELTRVKYAGLNKLLASKVTSEHEQVRRLASKAIANKGFKRFIDSFDRLDPKTRQLAGKAMLELDEEALDRLTGELKHADPAQRLRAIRIIEATGSHDKLQETVLDLVKDPDTKVRATITQMLAAMKNTEAIKALVRLLSDKDERVQANTVEAIESLKQPQFRQLLVPFLRHPNNRIRGNACKALWGMGITEVAQVMFAMLDDAGAKMRMTAAWALRETRPPGALEKLRAALDKEEDAGVKSRLLQAEAALAGASSGKGN